jgi:PAS domain S-box-containing protein/putative nucleotidyltransferase with HDIG domain
MLQGEAPPIFETYLLTKKRKRIPVEIAVTLLEGCYGQKIVFQGNVRDITERKKIEEELEKHRKHLEGLVEERTVKLKVINELLRQEISDRKRAEKIQASLYRIAEATQSTENLEELYQIIHETITELMPAKNNFYIALFDPDSEMISFPYFIDEYEENPGPQRYGKGLTEYVFRTGKSLLASPEVFKELEKKGEIASVGPPSIDWLGVSLKTKNKIIGVLTVQSYTEGVRYSEEDKNILTFISEQVAMAIERKQTDEALRESEERYKALYDRSLFGVYVHDLGGRFLDANEAALDLLGYKKEEILSINFASLLDESQLLKAFKDLEEIKKTGFQRKPSEYKLKKKEGHFTWVETEASMIYREGKPFAIQGIARDITERKRAERLLRDSEEKYRILAENAKDGIYIISPEGFVYVNPAFEKIFGYKAKEICGNHFNFIDLIHLEDRGLVREREQSRKNGKELPPAYSFRVITKDGKTKYVEVNTVSLSGEKVRILGILRDITERKHAEEALRESEERYKTLVQTSPDAVTVTDLEGNITYVSPRTLELHGFKNASELLGRSAFDLIDPADHEKAIKNIKKTLKVGTIRDVEYVLLKKDGTHFTGELNSALIKDAEGNPKMFIGTTRDITESIKAKEVIKESEERYRDLVEKAGIAILIDDIKGDFKYFNKKFASLFGYSVEEMEKLSIQSIVHLDDVDMVMKYHKGRVSSKKVPTRYEFRGIKKDGSDIYLEVDAVTLKGKGKGHIIGTRSYMWDITERKKAQEVIQESEEKFKTLFNSASDAIFIHDLGGHFLEVNEVACDRLGYNRKELLKMGLEDIDSPKLVTMVPARTEELDQRGHIFYETVHMRRDGTVIPIELSSRIIEYNGEPVALSIARDITERKQAEEERKQSFERLQRALEDTVNALASALEMRDPYTAGHQRRVADLACAIAKEMGLSEKQIDGIRLAGIIHDVGKIRVPGEILSWPGKLTEIDFNIIKAHPQVGYNILKTIEFPYSVAKIMLQHHERMDGSGYPSGLKDGEILQEAKILAVADVVEAMASHRPYRPARGIEKALVEIAKNKVVLYDPKVADACLKLFKEKKYKFK